MTSGNLLVASSRAPQLSLVTPCISTNTSIFTYNYETATLDDILGKLFIFRFTQFLLEVLVGIHRQLQGRKIKAVGFLLHSLESEMFLCFSDGRVVSELSVSQDSAIRNFFKHIVQSYVSPRGGRLDFLNSCLTSQSGSTVLTHLETFLNVSFSLFFSKIILNISDLCRDLEGSFLR